MERPGIVSLYRSHGGQYTIQTPYSCADLEGGFSWGPLNLTDSNSNAVIKDLLTIPSLYASNRLTIRDLVEVQVSPGTRAVDYGLLDEHHRGKDVLVPLVSHDSALSCPPCRVPVVTLAACRRELP